MCIDQTRAHPYAGPLPLRNEIAKLRGNKSGGAQANPIAPIENERPHIEMRPKRGSNWRNNVSEISNNEDDRDGNDADDKGIFNIKMKHICSQENCGIKQNRGNYMANAHLNEQHVLIRYQCLVKDCGNSIICEQIRRLSLNTAFNIQFYYFIQQTSQGSTVTVRLSSNSI